MTKKTKAVRKREAVAKVKLLLKQYVSPFEALEPNKPHMAVKRVVYCPGDGIAILFGDGTWTTSMDKGFDGYVQGFNPFTIVPYLYALCQLSLLEEEEDVLFRDWLQAIKERQDHKWRVDKLQQKAEDMGTNS